MKRKQLTKKQRNLLGPKLRQARRETGLSQERVVELLELKYALKMDRTALTRLENRGRSIDDFEIKALAGLYGVSFDWLFDA